MNNNTYRTGTAKLNSISNRDTDRWFVAREDGLAVFFRTATSRDRHVRELNSGLVAWGPKADGQTGTSENINAKDYLYTAIKFDEPSPVNGYQQRYEDLARALAAEATRRNWCPEWEKFADANDIPKELRTPPKVKLRVTLEVEVDLNVDASPKAVARGALMDHITLDAAIRNGKVERL